METRKLGTTELEVTRLGAGLSEIGYNLSPGEEAVAGQVLNYALDRGINFLDTSACYDISEEMIGRYIAHRRDEYVLATKCGHGVGDYQGQDWTVETINDSIDRSLKRMKTDHVDLLQFHSCDVDVLEQDEIIQTLLDAQAAGKTRYIGYSGDNEAALWAVESGIFDTLQTSFNLVDQHARTRLFTKAKANGLGIIIKRPIANGAWGVSQSPSDYADEYFARAQALAQAGPIVGVPENRILFSLGFTLAHQEVDTVIVGTISPKHMLSNIEMVEEQLPISADVVIELQRRFDELGAEWVQLR